MWRNVSHRRGRHVTKRLASSEVLLSQITSPLRSSEHKNFVMEIVNSDIYYEDILS